MPEINVWWCPTCKAIKSRWRTQSYQAINDKGEYEPSVTRVCEDCFDKLEVPHPDTVAREMKKLSDRLSRAPSPPRVREREPGSEDETQGDVPIEL